MAPPLKFIVWKLKQYLVYKKQMTCLSIKSSGIISFITIATNPFETFHLRPHSFQIYSFETPFFWVLLIWDHIHLRPKSFGITFTWDHIHLRTTFIWGPHSFETTFIWDHIHLRPHSFASRQSEAVLSYCESDFYDLPSTSLRETCSFVRWLFIWSFAR